MQINEYLLMIRKQAREGLATSVECSVSVDIDGNIVAHDALEKRAELRINIHAPVKLCPEVDAWGHSFGPPAAIRPAGRLRERIAIEVPEDHQKAMGMGALYQPSEVNGS